MSVDHAVIVRFTYGLGDLDTLYQLEDNLTDAIEQAGVGEFDGHEIATDLSDGSIYMYGPDADALLAAVRPVLEASFTKGATCICRYGDVDDPKARVTETII